jgi:phage-related protein
LSADDRRAVGEDIRDCEFSWPIGLPPCRPLGRGLWEIRSDLSNGRIARVIFTVFSGHMVLLHGFMKKTRRTPRKDLAIAIHRLKSMD